MIYMTYSALIKSVDVCQFGRMSATTILGPTEDVIRIGGDFSE